MLITPNPYHWDRVNLKLFYGRERLVTDLVTDLNANHSCAVVGGRKMGKTTLLRHVERVLTEKIQPSLAGGSLTLPVYIHTLELPHPLTPKIIYVDIIKKIETQLKSLGLLKKSHAPLALIFDEFPHEENRAFTSILTNVIEAVPCFLQIVILVDEIEPIACANWSSGFFNNWRHLLSNEPDLSSHVCIVFSGAKEMAAIARDVSSPLANILSWYELALFTKDDSAKLINESTHGNISGAITKRIFNWTGGHPFLIQYLMHYICKFDLEESQTRLNEARQHFYNSQTTQFYSWWFEKFSDEDRRTYSHLAEKSQATPKRDIIKLLGDVAANKSLAVLCHTGTAKKIEKGESYKVAGTMFKDWVRKHCDWAATASIFDQNIHDALKRLSPDIANKYISAWSIHATELPNYSGAVSELRDVVTLVLHHLAPDERVKLSTNYSPEKDSSGKPLTKPTRKQRTDYIIRNKGGRDVAPINADIDFLDTLISQLSRVVGEGYSHASARTHTVATRDQAWKCLKQLDSILAQLL